MAIDLDDLTRNTACNAILALLNVGGAGSLKVFAEAKPANCAAADPATILSIHALSDPAFANAGTGGQPVGQALANPIGDDASANNSGNPGCFRLYDNAGNCRLQGTAGVASGNLSFATGIVAGLPVEISNLTFLVKQTGSGP